MDTPAETARGRVVKRSVVHLSTGHLTNDLRIFYKECVSLQEAGFEVVLIARRDADGVDRGVRLVAVKTGGGRLWRVTYGVWRVLRAALREGADLYHFHDPELIPLGLVLKGLGKRVVYDAHENVPEDVLAAEWIPWWLRPMVSRVAGTVEALAACCFDGIVAATPHIARRFPRHKTVTAQNFPVFKESVAANRPPFAQRPAKVVYVGVIVESRGICEVVRAMSLLPKSLGARLCLIGGIRPASLEARLRATPGWEHVDFLGWRDQREVANHLADARVGIVTFWPARCHFHCQPTKLFEYMSAGLPLVASGFPLWRGFVEGAGCGLIVDPRDPQAIARAIERLLADPEEAEQMGRRGRLAIAECLNWQKEFQGLLELYDRLLHGTHQRGRRTTPVHQSGDPQRGASRAA
jgi:glycosyltransferase involved in cell wall biosynthesis